MTKRKHLPEDGPRLKRVAGYLTCDTCQHRVPYQGYEDPALDERPAHRCGRDIRPFTKFVPGEDRREPKLPMWP